MSFLRKHAEIIFSYLIGIVSLFTGLIILINLPLIKQLNGGKKVDTHVHNVWEFLNAFFSEIIKVMSRFIGNFPIVSAIVIIIFGILVMLIGHTLLRTIKYDYDISILFLSYRYHVLYYYSYINDSSLWILCSDFHYSIYNSYRIYRL